MGLSIEERLSKFYWSMTYWRHSINRLADELSQSRMLTCPKPYAEETVRGWVARIDRIVGKCVTQSDNNSLYWIMGSNEANYKSLFEEYYSLGYQNQFEQQTASYGSLAWVKEHYDLTMVAQKWTDKEFHMRDATIIAAMWWDAYRYIAALLYPINRYNDGLFQSVIVEFTELVGEMINCRYHIMNDGSMSDRYASVHELGRSIDQSREIEHVLLCKYRVFKDKLQKAEHEVIHNLRGAEYEKAYYADQFDVASIVTEVESMSLVDTKEYLETMYRESEQKNSECHQKKAEKEQKRTYLMGKSIRSYEELLKVIEDPNVLESDYNVARRELDSAYGCWVGDFASRVNKNKKKNTKK